MSKIEKINKSHPFLGWICVLLGLYLLAIAFDFLSVDSESIFAPMWIIGLCGLVFIISGCMILFRQHDRLIDILAAIICFSFAAIGIWVSLFSPSDGFSGGIPFLSKELNIFLARGVFGLGAIITSLLCVYAIRRALR
ncbi:MAG: hypothetical protein AB8B89_08370 [Gammaproteobacteria bacterium]